MSVTDLSALREAVAIVAERCDCGDNGCPFRVTGGMRTNGGCRMTHDRTRGHVVSALGLLFRAARALVGDGPKVEPTSAEVWRAEAERLRRLLGEMVNEAEARPDVNRAWLSFIESEMEKTP